MPQESRIAVLLETLIVASSPVSACPTLMRYWFVIEDRFCNVVKAGIPPPDTELWATSCEKCGYYNVAGSARDIGGLGEFC